MVDTDSSTTDAARLSAAGSVLSEVAFHLYNAKRLIDSDDDKSDLVEGALAILAQAGLLADTAGQALGAIRVCDDSWHYSDMTMSHLAALSAKSTGGTHD